MVGISYDSVEKLKQFTEKTGSKLLLLSDEGSKTIDAYGIRNKEMAGRPIDGIPYPGTYIVDKEGVIRAKLFLDGYLLRHTTDALIEGAGK